LPPFAEAIAIFAAFAACRSSSASNRLRSIVTSSFVAIKRSAARVELRLVKSQLEESDKKGRNKKPINESLSQRHFAILIFVSKAIQQTERRRKKN
jgi:hypothetical protein